MGIMQNKVTRRVALGTVAAGLGSTVLVLQALKGKYRTKLPTMAKHPLQKDPDYNKDWEHYARMVDVPVKPIDGPSDVVLDLRAPAGTEYGVVSIRSVYDSEFSPAKYPAPPLWYSISEGRISVIPPVVNEKLAIMVSTVKQFTKQHLNEHADRSMDLPTSKCVFVPTDNGMDCYETDGNAFNKVACASVDAACADFGRALLSGYPRGKLLAKGTRVKLTTSGKRGYHIEIPYEVADFVQIAGNRTVKLVGKKNLNDEEVRHYVDDRDVMVLQQMQHSNQPRRELPAKAIQFVAYVDLKTGLALRQECRLSDLRSHASRTGQISLRITQVLNS